MSEDNAPEPIISTYSSKYPLIPKRSYTTILDSKKEYMFTHIETLIALAALECEVGRPLTEAHGRGVRLTRASHRLLTRVEPRVLAGIHRARIGDLGASCSDACADRASNGALLSKSAAPCKPSPASCKWPATASATAWYPRVSPARSASAPAN